MGISLDCDSLGATFSHFKGTWNPQYVTGGGVDDVYY